MEENWIMTSKDEYDYNDLSTEDKNIIFEDLNKMVYRFKDKERKMIKASFVHRWKPESAVAFKLMVRTHQKLCNVFRLPDEQLSGFQIETGRVWNGAKVTWMIDAANEGTEELQDMYEKLLNGDTSSHIEIATHQGILDSVKREEEQKTEALVDEIKKLKQQLEYKDMSIKAAENRYEEFKQHFWKKIGETPE
jgi:predicted secreted protein